MCLQSVRDKIQSSHRVHQQMIKNLITKAKKTLNLISRRMRARINLQPDMKHIISGFHAAFILILMKTEKNIFKKYCNSDPKIQCQNTRSESVSCFAIL